MIASEVKTLLSSLDSDRALPLLFNAFSGLRKRKLLRLDWSEVSQGLAVGAIYLPASEAKTGQSRSVTIGANLQAWLERYRKPIGPALPEGGARAT